MHDNRSGASTSAAHPRARKPIVGGARPPAGAVLRLQRLDELPTHGRLRSAAGQPGPWLAAFRLSLRPAACFCPGAAVGQHDAAEVITNCSVAAPHAWPFRALVDAWGNTRPAGQRLLHRVTDTALPGSAAPARCRRATCRWASCTTKVMRAWWQRCARCRGCDAGDPQRVALEGYPGLLAHELIGRRSYKNDADPPNGCWRARTSSKRWNKAARAWACA
jgi:hypothetical protein